MRGSIQQRGLNSWRIRFEREPGPDGKRRRHEVTFRGTRKEAQRKLTELLAAGDGGTLADPTQVTVGDYLRQYLANATHLSLKTAERYGQLLAQQIAPHIGSIRLQVLRAEHLEAWYKKLAAEVSPRTIGNAHRFLRSVLARALSNGTISRNVATTSRQGLKGVKMQDFEARRDKGHP